MLDGRFLVTGAMGCLGAWTVKRLLDEGAMVCAYDRATNPHRLRLLIDDQALARVNVRRPVRRYGRRLKSSGGRCERAGSMLTASSPPMLPAHRCRSSASPEVRIEEISPRPLPSTPQWRPRRMPVTSAHR